ncbi:hypothetical protein I552_3695 [Mycobacterium xenopi 3993]|nr:hypothetical protein I552_3695 [Mycobacterium xenopi 3993]
MHTADGHDPIRLLRRFNWIRSSLPKPAGCHGRWECVGRR